MTSKQLENAERNLSLRHLSSIPRGMDCSPSGNTFGSLTTEMELVSPRPCAFTSMSGSETSYFVLPACRLILLYIEIDIRPVTDGHKNYWLSLFLKVACFS